MLPYLAVGSDINIEKQRTTVNLIASVAKHSPKQIAPMMGNIVPGIVGAVKKDDDELREGCLQVGCCQLTIVTY